MVIAATIYLLVAVTSSLLVPADVLAGASGRCSTWSVGRARFPLKIFSAIGLFAVINSALINMLMASRLLYGMANEGLIPRQFGTVHPSASDTVGVDRVHERLAIVLVVRWTSKRSAARPSLLLLMVFAIVNVAVLVLRREKVEHRHFRAPTWIPVLGAVSCVFFASPLTGRDLSEYGIVAVLLAIGFVFWLINQFAMRKTGSTVDSK